MKYTIYRKNGLVEKNCASYDEFIAFVIGQVKMYKRPLNNILCHYSIEHNVKHHPVRILREMGYIVERTA